MKRVGVGGDLGFLTARSELRFGYEYTRVQARTSTGSLAGSTLTLDVALRNIIAATGCSLNEAVMMSGLTPARSIGMSERKGNLTPGYDADITVLDDALQVTHTIVNGALVYAK